MAFRKAECGQSLAREVQGPQKLECLGQRVTPKLVGNDAEDRTEKRKVSRT